jgi:exonuclease III
MKLVIISQNMQGLNDPAKLDIVRHYFRPMLSKVDIVCFQEHKLRDPQLLALKDAIWPQAGFYTQEASLGYRHTLGQVGAGKGGVCMWVAPAIQHLVTSTGHSRCGRAQWARFLGIPGGDVNVINMYASTETMLRIELWKELTRVLPRDYRSVFLGDFNFVENRDDKSSLCGKLISARENMVFAQLKSLLDIEDRYPATSSIRFSWDNRRQGVVRILARLDRVYTFQNPAIGIELVKEYYIKGGSAHSDHLAVWYHLSLSVEPPRKSSYKLSTYFLKNEEVKRNFE